MPRNCLQTALPLLLAGRILENLFYLIQTLEKQQCKLPADDYTPDNTVKHQD